MKNMKKFFLSFALLFFVVSLFFNVLPAQAIERPNEDSLVLFYSTRCSHCKDAREFLDEIGEDYPEFKVEHLDIAKNTELVKEYYDEYSVPQNMYGMVPIFFLNDKHILGFSESIKKELAERIVTSCQEYNQQQEEENKESICEEGAENKVEVPIFGKIDLSNFGPLALSIVLGVLDGFNACAMVALGFLLTILIATGTRKRVFWIGGTFILVSGLVYYFFIAAWFNIVSFFWDYKAIVNTVISIIVIASAIFLLRDYAKGVVCKLCKIDPNSNNFLAKTERKLFSKLNHILSEKRSLVAMILGVAVVAVGINTIELSCSFALPMVFTGILKNWNISGSPYYLYLLIYVVFYMLDDFIIFMIAVITLKKVDESSKYFKAIKLISGILLLVLGIIMLIKPELLIL